MNRATLSKRIDDICVRMDEAQRREVSKLAFDLWHGQQSAAKAAEEERAGRQRLAEDLRNNERRLEDLRLRMDALQQSWGNIDFQNKQLDQQICLERGVKFAVDEGRLAKLEACRLWDIKTGCEYLKGLCGMLRDTMVSIGKSVWEVTGERRVLDMFATPVKTPSDALLFVAAFRGFSPKTFLRYLAHHTPNTERFFILAREASIEVKANARPDPEDPEHNYMKKLKTMREEGKIAGSGLHHVNIAHDRWCAIDEGGLCNCNPDVTLRATHKLETDEVANG
jgi:hypothetical protein